MRIKRVVDAIERAVPAPQIEIIVQRRARRQVRRNRAPLTAGAQNIHQAVDHLAHHDMTPVSTALGRRNERLHKRPFLVRHIARIAQSASVIASAIFCSSTSATPPNESGRLLESQMIPPFNLFSDGLSGPSLEGGCLPGATEKFQRPGIALRSQLCAGRSRERTAPGASRGRAVFAAPDASALANGGPHKLATIATQSHSRSHADNASRCLSSIGANAPLPKHLQVNAPIERAGEASLCGRPSAGFGCHCRRSSLGSSFAG